MAYDSLRNVVVMFAMSSLGVLETWEWNGAQWVFRTSVGPSARNAALAFDSNRGMVVLFGGLLPNGLGQPPPLSSETWEWDGSDWTFRTDEGPL